MQKIIVGNWKMHGDAATARPLVEAVAAAADKYSGAKVILCPPATLLSQVSTWLVGSAVKLGGQDCHTEAKGAFTGDISAPMLADVGCTYVIVGHSERRQQYGETDALVAKKALAAIARGLKPIICIGETAEERDAGRAEAVVARQMRESVPKEAVSGHFLLAYEPVWAIGSGRTATGGDIHRMHACILSIAPVGSSVLYGGSVKADNAAEILAVPGVSGVLVGGASVRVEEFCKIIEAAS